MRIQGVDFPEAVLKAQRDGTLVVFAGAGVSMGPPADYPDFAELAEEISAGTLSREEGEPIDRFLGRLASGDVNVHKLAQERLSQPGSSPNPLHSHLLRLFLPSSPRLVTTNFDSHFTTAARSCLGSEVECFYAPALPLGHEFSGIVYLHGSVEKEATSLVLTDSDFGRAYLTEGWAQRFLRAMFQKYTVLFVGYSHNDPIMTYLARGLPSSSVMPRFGLTQPGEKQKWRFLGIEPITYEVTNSDHGALVSAVGGWVLHSRQGLLDREKRIRQLVEAPPPMDPEESDYVEDALSDPATARFFTRHARKPDWLRWIERKGLLKPLFDPAAELTEVERELAAWFAESFVCKSPQEALGVVERVGQRLNVQLWGTIAHRLLVSQPDPTSFAKWIALLLQNAQPQYSSMPPLEHLLHQCRHPEHDLTAIMLLEHLTRPRLGLKKGMRMLPDATVSDSVDAEMEIHGNRHGLKAAWENVFKPNLAAFVEELEPILTSHIRRGHYLLRSVGEAKEGFDPISLRRSAIEPHKQDEHGLAFHAVIDAARDVLEWQLQNNGQHALAIIDVWADSGVALLQRLAVHGMSEAVFLDADTKLHWLLNREWLHAGDLRHEVFRLLKRAYPEASERVRATLLEQAESGPPRSEDEDGDDERNSYIVYNLLAWLQRSAPDCRIVMERLERLQKQHPDFRPREHPDFRVWRQFGWGTQSAITVDELLSKDPEKEIDWLLTYQGEEHFDRPSREGLLGTVAEAVAENWHWGHRLAKELSERDEWESDIWEYVLRGWKECSLTSQQWGDVLGFFVEHPQINRRSNSVAEVLLKSAAAHHDAPSGEVLPLAMKAADRLWRDCELSPPGLALSDERDWHLQAINHPGGKLADFWLRLLSIERRVADVDWAGIPMESKERLNRVVDSQSEVAELARVVLASELFFLAHLERDWAMQNVLPLLDWSKDEKRAKQAWHGFLFSQRIDLDLVPDLLPVYIQTFPHVGELGEQREGLAAHLSLIALHGPSSPLQNGWLQTFLRDVELTDREWWAHHIGRQLEFANDELKQSAWRQWINEYWGKRIAGVPLTLADEELKEMAGWAVHLGPVFPECVGRICEGPAPSLRESLFYHQLSEPDHAEKHADDLARLLGHLLSGASQPFWACEEIHAIMHRLIQARASKQLLLSLCEQLASLGDPRASELQRLVEDQLQ